MRRFTLLSLTILLASCTTTMTNYYQPTVNSWQGGSAANLVKHWGKPDRVISTADGKTVYLYENSSYRSNNTMTSYPAIGMHVSNSGRAELTGSPVESASWNSGRMSVICVATFEAGKDGKILGTHIQGSNCYMSESAAHRLLNSSKN